MALMFDPFAGRQRQQELLQEAENVRLARQAQKDNREQADQQANGTQSLRSRMVKLLSGSNHTTSMQVVKQAVKQGESEGTLSQQRLVNAKGR